MKAEKKFRLDEQKIWETTEKAPKILVNFCVENSFLAFLCIPISYPFATHFPNFPWQCHGCQVVQAKAETKYAIKEAERAKQAQHGEKGNRQPEVPEVFRLSSHFSF